MPGMKKKTPAVKSKRPAVKVTKKMERMSALDKAIMEGRPLPSKNRRVPADTDVKMPGFKKKPVIRIKKK